MQREGGGEGCEFGGGEGVRMKLVEGRLQEGQNMDLSFISDEVKQESWRESQKSYSCLGWSSEILIQIRWQ